MSWSKLKQQLESFLSPALETVEYSATGYRYSPDKAGLCYIMVDKKKVFNMTDQSTMIKWYQSEQEIKQLELPIPISTAEIEKVRKDTNGVVPEERLLVIARNRKISVLAKELLTAQSDLSKSNFTVAANQFLSLSIEESLSSNSILLNTLALIDRRVGKKRILNLKEQIKLKHPIVQYFYELRLHTL